MTSASLPHCGPTSVGQGQGLESTVVFSPRIIGNWMTWHTGVGKKDALLGSTDYFGSKVKL